MSRTRNTTAAAMSDIGLEPFGEEQRDDEEPTRENRQHQPHQVGDGHSRSAPLTTRASRTNTAMVSRTNKASCTTNSRRDRGDRHPAGPASDAGRGPSQRRETIRN